MKRLIPILMLAVGLAGCTPTITSQYRADTVFTATVNGIKSLHDQKIMPDAVFLDAAKLEATANPIMQKLDTAALNGDTLSFNYWELQANPLINQLASVLLTTKAKVTK